MDRVIDLASKKAVVIYTKSSICMCHSAKALFHEPVASPAIYQVDQDANWMEMYWEIHRQGCNPSTSSAHRWKI